MPQYNLPMFACLIWAASPVVAQAPPKAEPQGTYLGALFGPIPEALYDHLPSLPRGHGVIVTHVLPDSPAALVPLKRNDIVLDYDGQKIRDCEHFARLIQADMPRKVHLGLVRAGKEMAVEVTLGRGPALKIVASQRSPYQNNLESNVAKGTAKGNGPAPISVSALPLENDRMRITIEYYQEGNGRLRALTVEGSNPEIDSECGKLPERERNQVRRALEKIRALNSPRQQPSKNEKP